MRLPTLAHQSFWLDESYTALLVRQPFWHMLKAVRITESTPPVYYVSAWLWTHALGHSEYGLRSLSALAGVLTVLVVYQLGSRVAGQTAGVIAGLLASVSPLLVWFSQEARAYSLAVLFSTLSALLWFMYLDERRRVWLVLWALASCLGLATHYFVAFLVALEAVALVLLTRGTRAVRGAVASTAAVALLLLPLALAQRGTGHADYIAEGSLPVRLLQIPKQFMVGYASPGQTLTAALVTILLLVGCAPSLARRRADRRLWALLALGIGAIAIPVVLAISGVDFVNTRNVLPALPPLLVVAAAGIADQPRRLIREGVAGILTAMLLGIVILATADSRYQRDDWRGASRAIGVPRGPRVLVVSPGDGAAPLQVYQPGVGPLLGRAAVTEIDVIAIPPRRTGEGLSAAPRLKGALPEVPGFSLERVVHARTFEVARLAAPRPTEVAASAFTGFRLDGGPVGVLIQHGG